VIFFTDTDNDILVSVSANPISASAKWISAILVSAKYRLKNLDIGQNIGKYRYLGKISTKYWLRKHIGVSKNISIGLAKISVLAKISPWRKYRYQPISV
jgi:hypothetical protein